jgi:hypothetical protein
MRLASPSGDQSPFHPSATGPGKFLDTEVPLLRTVWVGREGPGIRARMYSRYRDVPAESVLRCPGARLLPDRELQ